MAGLGGEAEQGLRAGRSQQPNNSAENMLSAVWQSYVALRPVPATVPRSESRAPGTSKSPLQVSGVAD